MLALRLSAFALRFFCFCEFISFSFLWLISTGAGWNQPAMTGPQPPLATCKGRRFPPTLKYFLPEPACRPAET